MHRLTHPTRFFCSSLFTYLAITCCAYATPLELTEEEQAWIKANPTVYVAGEPDWAPFDFIDASGTYGGLSWDYLLAIGEMTGLNFHVEVSPWHKSLQRLKEQKIDLVPAIFYAEHREEFVLFSDIYYETLEYFFIKEGTGINNIDDIRKLRVAIPRAYEPINTLEQEFPGITIVEVDTVGDAIDAVIQGRAEVLHETYATIDYLLKKDGINNIKPFYTNREIETQKVAIGVAKDKPILHNIINKGLRAITSDKRRQMELRWLSKSPEDKTRISFTQKELDWIKNNANLRFNGIANWLPYEAFDDDKKYVGIVPEYLKLIESLSEFRFAVSAGKDVETTRQRLQAGEIDVLTDSIGSSFKDSLVFTKSFLTSPVVIVMRQDTSYVGNINQIRKKRIAIIENVSYSDRIISGYPSIDFIPVTNVEEGITKVSTGEIDAMLVNLSQASYHISLLGFNNVRIVGRTEFVSSLAFGVSKNKAELVPILNKIMSAIPVSEQQRIISRWGNENFVTVADYRFVIYIILVALFIMAAMFYWNRKLSRAIRLRKEAQSQLQKIINAMPAQVFVTDLKGMLIQANPQFVRDFEMSESDLDGFCVDDLFIDLVDRKAIEHYLTEENMVKNMVIKLRRKGLQKVHSLMLNIIPIRFQGRNALLAMTVDLTEQLEIEEELRQAKDLAEIATRSKSEFLANMSHEIRTPMNAIMGFSELLEKSLKDTRLKTYARTIKSSSNSLLTIVNDILDLSKIESGKVNIEKSPEKPKQLFDDLYQIFKLSARNKGLRMVFTLDDRIPEVLNLDIARLRQVLINLLGNAIKFTDIGQIKLHAFVESTASDDNSIDLRIDVSDSGSGISKSDLDSIFEKFQQAKSGANKDKGGTGLGLAISQRLVALMGGEITVDSEIGKGTVFSIHLKQVEIVTDISEVDIDNECDYEAIRFDDATILVVDDVTTNRSLVLEFLKGYNLNLLEANNGQNALDTFKNNQIDLVLMDLRMPVMDGHEATVNIRKKYDTIVIALTASVMKADLERIESRLFNSYLRKPVSREELVTKLAEYLPHQKAATKKKPKTSEHEPELTFKAGQFDEFREDYEAVIEENNLGDIADFGEKFSIHARQKNDQQLADIGLKLAESAKNFDISEVQRILKKMGKIWGKTESA